MHGVVVIELKGFAEISGPLSYRMDKIGLRDTQIKLKYRNIVNGLIAKSGENFPPINYKEIGGDTWVIQLNDIDEALHCASHILRLAYEQVVKSGLYYIKPVVAVGEAKPVFEGDRFLDNETISIYRVADSGEPFALYVINAPQETKYVTSIDLNDKLEKLSKEVEISEVDWKYYNFSHKDLALEDTFYLSSLLHDNDIALFQTSHESLSKFSELQHKSKKIFAFGGAVKYNSQHFDEYVRSMFSLFSTKDVKCYVLTYLDKHNSAINTYYWLSLCKLFLEEYPAKFVFGFYEIEIDKVKPLSFHIYDEEFVHLVLRSYQPAEDTHTMSSSVLINNTLLARKFTDEFLENFRKVPNANCHIIDAYIQDIALSDTVMKEIDSHIVKLRML